MASNRMPSRTRQAQADRLKYPSQVARNVAEAKVGLVSQLELGARRRLKV